MGRAREECGAGPKEYDCGERRTRTIRQNRGGKFGEDRAALWAQAKKSTPRGRRQS